ncbi:MAG: glycosyltransferase family 39 protein [Anaerolineae bacterium]|nr:glycosyltransferase family 39 protein [Anaerolineae bacterium]
MRRTSSFRPFTPESKRREMTPLLMLCAYLALAFAYSLSSPLYEPTDELRHFRYVRHIAVYHTLPIQQAEGPRAQSHHPPLYYLLGALVSGWVPVAQDVYYEPPVNPYWGYRYWETGVDNKNQYLHGEEERFPPRGIALAVYLVRWMTIFIGACTVWLTYRIGREILPDHPWVAWGSMALVAFNPQFLYLSGAINNDIPASLCGAAVLLMCIRMIKRGHELRDDVILGILYGLAVLTKFHLIALLPLIALAYLLAGRSPSWWSARMRGMLIVLSLAALLSGWWFWRNFLLYGDPTGMRKVNELWDGRPALENLWAIPQSLPYLWSSLWGRFGYGQIPLPPSLYQGALVFCILALAGYLVPRRNDVPWRILVLLAAAVIIFCAVVCYYIAIQPAGAMGRFLFPVLPAFAALLMVGLRRLWPAAMARWAWPGIAVGMIGVALYSLLGVLMPASLPPGTLSAAQIAAIPNRSTVELGGIVRMLGYQVTPTAIEPGGAVEVTVYWQPLARPQENYAVFVHLLSDTGALVAQRDTFTGLSRYPSTIWKPGRAFADVYRIHVPETAYAPDTCSVLVGMYVPGGSRLMTPDGRDAIPLATVEIQARPGPLPNPLDINFGKQVALVGYALDRRVTHPGDTLTLRLYWQALQPVEADYRIFAHVLGVDNQLWANSDWPPQPPTSQWQPGQVIEDIRELTVGQTTPPGFYDIEIGVYIPGGARLPVVARDGRPLDNRALLCTIRVVE